jgi:hypothetical protein
MKTSKNLGLAALLSMSLIGNANAQDNLGDYRHNPPQDYAHFNQTNYPDFRTGYDSNLSKPKATDSLPDLSGAIPLGVLTAGILTLLALGFRSNNKEFRNDSGRNN